MKAADANVDAEALAIIAGIIAEVTGRKGVEPNDGFRELGGDSLRAVKAAGRIAVEFGCSDETNERMLEALLDGAGASELARIVSGAIGDSEPVPQSAAEVLSYGEERLWLAQRYHPRSPVYHVVNAFRVVGDLDLERLDRAVRALADRHPALRTRYDVEAPRLADDTSVPDGIVLTRHDRVLPWEDAMNAAGAAALVPFELGAGRLLRVSCYRTGEAEYLLLIVVHHIATDGWSMDLIYRDLTDLYGERPCRAALPGSYREFARWQRHAAQPLDGAIAIADRLRPVPERIELSRHRLRPPARTMAGAVLRGHLPPQTARRLESLAAATGVSLHVVLLAVFYLCLARRTRQRDMLIGSVLAGRTQPRYHDTVGFFASTLPVRVTADRDTTLAELLAGLAAQCRWLLGRQDVPLEEVAVRTREAPDRAHGPVMDAVLIFQANDGMLPEFAGCAVSFVPLHTATAKFDLTLEVTPDRQAGSLGLVWEYATGILTEADVADLATSFARLADSVGGDAVGQDVADDRTAAAGPGQSVRSLTGISVAERELGTAVATGPERGQRIPDASLLFERLVTSDPAAPAVMEGATTVDRAGLRALRNRLVGCLTARGLRSGDVVAVHLPRSARSVAALLAAWWIGAVPLFVDVHHPDGHRDDLIRACRPAAVLTDETVGWPPGTPVVGWDDAVHASPCSRPPARRSAEDPAWLVATSGSTGEPKITAGTHRGLLNRCAWAWDAFPFGESDVAAVRTPLGFVDAIAEVAVPLLAGVPLAIVPDRPVWDVRDLVDVLWRHRVTRLLGTPTLLSRVLDLVPDLGQAAPALRLCVCSGEALGQDLLARLRAALPGCRLVNLYGSSEVAADAVAAEVTEVAADRPVPIGWPIANTVVHVVDTDGEQVPPGVVGELVVSGAPVGLGYLVDGKLTAAGGFRPAPDGSPGYWTGDLGWLGPDGLLYFAGRRDRQVKVRGCRVELGQVETAMLGLPGVWQAAAWSDRGDGGDRVYAAAVPPPGADVTGAGLRVGLRDRLPGYMVPVRIAVLEALPLSANGKLDRAALARLAGPPEAADPGPELPPAQRYLQQAWSAVLDGEIAGPDEDFFALGGDSLAANAMLARVMHDTGTALELGHFLAVPTIRALAARLGHDAGHPGQAG